MYGFCYVSLQRSLFISSPIHVLPPFPGLDLGPLLQKKRKKEKEKEKNEKNLRCVVESK